MKTQNFRAYTLVEVVVVCGIIAVLAGIVFAVMGPAREKSRERVCMSNLRQIGQALAIYRADYDGAEATVGQPMTHAQLGLPDGMMLTAFFTNYAKDPKQKLMECPFYTDTPPDDDNRRYMWGIFDDNSFPSGPKFTKLVAQRGGELPIVMDKFHNPPYDIAKAPRWTTIKVMALRLDLSVNMKQVPLRATSPAW